MKLTALFTILLAITINTAVAQSDLGAVHALNVNDDYEPEVVEVISLIQSGNLPKALVAVDSHLKDFPKSRVGHFLRADILTAMSAPLLTAGEGVDAELGEGFRHQIRNRWKHANAEPVDIHTRFPSNLIDLGQHPFVVVADMPEGRLYVYQNLKGKPHLIRDYYMSVGSAGYGKQTEGDNKTPIGVYNVNRYIEGKALPDLYGKGAFPVNYPNRFDRYRKRTGYGIWLHGTPSSTYARSPWASEGCFVLSNDDLLDIAQYISADRRTPVILSDTIEWLSITELEQRRAKYLSVLAKWKTDWESLNTQAYLQHYSQEVFNLGKGKYQPWAKRKVQVNLGKTFVQVDFELQSLFLYPGEQDMFVVKYRQRYLSNNYSGEASKEQYWKRDGAGDWKIIYEG